MTVIADGHRPVDNWTESRGAAVKETAQLRPRIVSTQEPVAGYAARRKKPSRKLMLSAAPAAISAPAVSASVASFGTAADSLEIVFGNDDRAAITDPTEFPWRHICALRIESQSGRQYVGTGWFIGPSTLMTAGHCVYLHDDGGWPRSITVIPALDGPSEPYGHAVCTRFHTTEGWKNGRDTNFDYGAIQVDDAQFGEAPGWFAFGSLTDDDLRTNVANIAGYPADRDNASRLYFHSRQVMNVGATKLFYDIDTYGGQSGSPIFFRIGDDRVAVGVHTTGSSTSNSGTRITTLVAQNMKDWRDSKVSPPLRKAAGGSTP